MFNLILYLFFFLLELAVQVALWGGACYMIMKTKGYDSHDCKMYILWGSLFGIFAVISAACKPVFNNTYTYDDDYWAKVSGNPAPPFNPDEAKSRPLEVGFWRCPNCEKDNPDYTGSCSCGHSKYDS